MVSIGFNNSWGKHIFESVDPQDHDRPHRHRPDGNNDEQRPLNNENEEIFKYGYFISPILSIYTNLLYMIHF